MNPTTYNYNPKKFRGLKRFFSLLPLLLIVTVGVWALFNRQFIIDQLTVWQFKPSAATAALADESGMNSQGEFYYLASRPQLNERGDFNSNCTTKEIQTIVLGCYSSGQIYLFNVTDDRISGVKTVVAAHEMLHAAYERLSTGEREKLDALLKSQLANTTSQEVLDLVKIYDKTEPGERWNELHSIFATEVSDLSAELESYYKKYFSDRSKVVAAYEKYHQVFADLESRSDELQKSLASQKAAIDDDTSQYDTELQDLESDIKTFNDKAAALNGFASESEFNSARAALIARQKALTKLADSINAMVNAYNQDVTELNALGVEVDKLNQSLNSHSDIAE